MKVRELPGKWDCGCINQYQISKCLNAQYRILRLALSTSIEVRIQKENAGRRIQKLKCSLYFYFHFHFNLRISIFGIPYSKDFCFTFCLRISILAIRYLLFCFGLSFLSFRLAVSTEVTKIAINSFTSFNNKDNS